MPPEASSAAYTPLSNASDDDVDAAAEPPLSPDSTTSPFTLPKTSKRWDRRTAIVGFLVVVSSLVIATVFPATRLAWTSHTGRALPLRPHQHFGLANSTVPPRRLTGLGLTSAQQDGEAVFHIDFDGSGDPPLKSTEDIAVWLEGPARFAADVSYVGRGRYEARYTALDAGEYQLRAEVFGRVQVGMPYAYWLPLGLDAYNVTVLRRDGSRTRGDGRRELALPSERCRGDEGGGLGRWVRCEDTPLACTRYGWVWVPRDCMYRIYTASELAQQDLWIALVGTSVWRGIFFAGVDHLFGSLAANLSAPTSQFWKCWGRLSAESAKTRVSYLDFRQQCTTEVGALHCGGGDYLANTEKMLGMMGRERGGRGPDLVLWESNDNFHSDYDMLSLYRRWLGPSWSGTFAAAFRTYSPEVPYTHEEAGNIAVYASSNPEANVEALDISRLGGGMFDAMEFSLNHSATFHWHTNDDMIFQIAVNRAIERQRRLPPSPSSPLAIHDAGDAADDIKFCLQCPPKLDFSMRPDEDVQCFAGLPL
ncbi:hypothetical protein Rt10032_c13g5009 [Rhodotorula toruloides]|uniref:Uncharacterized protein n=1 Tax=Rhodotorula toruloides TaxID=5286 RepID=A0A511KKT2_RHOTO|nr:hypothetical protein Rt10032_c13g5009 [Rhodotorula toruloides]